MKLIILISLTFLISSCATMTAKECKVADWRSVGYSDALKGRPLTELENHRQTCKKAQVTPNKNLYLMGYKKGEQMYCTYENGVIAGEKRKHVSKICQSPTLNQFHQGYDIGVRRYQKIKEIEKLNEQLDALDARIVDIKKLESKNALIEIDLAYREKELINREISVLELELDHIQ